MYELSYYVSRIWPQTQSDFLISAITANIDISVYKFTLNNLKVRILSKKRPYILLQTKVIAKKHMDIWTQVTEKD